jgi:dolichol-phosphate mannosyltransferase
MLKLSVSDVTAGFRAHRRTLLERMDLDTIRADGYGFQIELTYRARMAAAEIVEVPIQFGERTRGESKMSLRIVAEALWLVTRWGLRLRFRSGGAVKPD